MPVKPFGELPLSAQLRIDQVCERFEAAWRTSHRPRAAEYLGELPDTERPALALALIALDLEYRRRAGESPTPEEYIPLSPGLRPDDLAHIFARPADTSEVTGAYTPTPDDQNRTGPHHAADVVDPPGEGRETVPGYEVLGELGRGGMGVVYRARQVSLNRIVALKLVTGRGRADRQELIRFLVEAEVAASVAHPNVVRVFDHGESNGRPFMALEFVPGGSLSQKLKAGGLLPPNEAAELVRRITDGVAAAHDRGVVHRDLKPGNVLLDAGGEPKVADFGLAKRAAGDDLTQTGAVMGTPSYMAPEQAKGESKFVGPQADVWALGVILYECLTGRVPFVGGSSHEVLRRVIEDTPTPPSRSGRLPRDLETVCLKCLEKAPADRYETAAELAAELGRFLAGEPILARPAGRAERAYKWARRKPWQAAALAAGALVVGLVPLAVVMSALYQQAEAERRNAEVAKGNAEEAKANEERERKRAQDAEVGEKLARGKAEKALAGEKAANERLERKNYAELVNGAARDAEAGLFDRARAALANCPEPLRGWEWHYVHRLCHADRITYRLEQSPTKTEGSTILGLLHEGTAYVLSHMPSRKLTLHEPTTGKLIRETSLAPLPPDLLKTPVDISTLTLDPQTGLLNRVPKTLGRQPATSRDGKRTVAAGPGLILRVRDKSLPQDDENPDPRTVLDGNEGGVKAVVITPDGKTAAAACGDSAVRVWDLDKGRLIAVLRGHTQTPTYLALTPDGKTVVTRGLYDFSSRVWDVMACAGPRVFTGMLTDNRPGHAPEPSTGAQQRVSWLSDNLAQNSVTLMPRTLDYSLFPIPVSGGQFLTPAYPLPANQDDTLPIPEQQALTGVRVYDTVTGRVVHTFPERTPSAAWATSRGIVTDDGKQLVLVDRGARRVAKVEEMNQMVTDPSGLWMIDLKTWAKRDVVRLPSGGWRPCGLSRDGRWAVLFNVGLKQTPEKVEQSPKYLVIDLATGGTLRELTPDGLGTTVLGSAGAALSDDGSLAAIGQPDGPVSVRHVADGRELFALRGHIANITSAEFAPGSRILATAGYDGRVILWDAVAGVVRHTCLPPSRVTTLAFSPDGKRLLTGDMSGRVVVWDPETGDSLVTLTTDHGPIQSVAFVPGTNRLLATAGYREDGRGLVGLMWDVSPINQSVEPVSPLHQVPTRSPVARRELRAPEWGRQ